MTATPEEILHRDIREWMHENGFDPQSLDDLIHKDKKSGYKVMNTRQREEAQLFMIRFDKLPLDASKIIGKFMGVIPDKKGWYDGQELKKAGLPFSPGWMGNGTKDLKFSTSYDWIMSVIVKIDTTRCLSNNIEKYYYCVKLMGSAAEVLDAFTGKVVVSVSIKQTDWMNSTYLLALKFINWYNKEKGLTPEIISYDEFIEKYKPVKNHLNSNASWDGWFFETYDRELAYVREMGKKKPRRIWTIIETDGVFWIVSGLHLVNRFGYIITESEWEHDLIEVKVDDD